MPALPPLGPAAVAVLLVVGAALVGLLALARRKAWNADGSDDERRRQGRGPDET